MNWQDIYKKYKDIEWMKEFAQHILGYSKERAVWYLGEDDCEIQDIWGYLICFAETKGIQIDIQFQRQAKKVFEVGIYYNIADYKKEEVEMNYEQAMLWCANKFFELG